MAVVNVKSEIAGNVWKIQVKAGDHVDVEGEIMILESMKMEIPLVASQDGVVSQVRVQPGSSVRAGQCVVVLETAV